MMQHLTVDEIRAPLAELAFSSTQELLSQAKQQASTTHAWVAQSAAREAALFGLNMTQHGFNVLVLGEQGSGRTSLMLSAMRHVAEDSPQQGQPVLNDWVAIYNFDQVKQPTMLKLPAGTGNELRNAMEAFTRKLVLEMQSLATIKSHDAMYKKAEAWLKAEIETLQMHFAEMALGDYFALVNREILGYLKAWQANTSEAEPALDGLVNEALLARFRVNVLVDHSQTALKRAVIYDNDPSLTSLFGSIDSTSDTSTPEFLRLRAGNLHKADGGFLLLNLADLLSDEANGAQILEKLRRFMRNGTLQIEDAASSAQSASYVLTNTLVPLKVKLVLVSTREDFYDCLDQNPDFFEYFPIKVEFAERILANLDNYAAIAGFVAQKCVQHNTPHFTREAVAALIGALQRLEEDQGRISTNFAYLERLMLESATFANHAKLVDANHVEAALEARSARHRYFETQIRDSIIDSELLIQVQGEVIGQVNGLTHIELGDASFGSPIRITARCYPGQKGLINIDREVNMSGPNHDKGIFILQNWLSASFSHLAPLSLNASLVFEQEYNGVEGDSASCAELFALLSALSGLPISQGIAVTGALNQFGEVMPVGGINEKIEGYFRVCQALGLTGRQGVIIPKRNQRHLLLDKTVVQAVEQGSFHIIAIDHVLEGIAYLTGKLAGDTLEINGYAAGSVMHHAETRLAAYRKTLETNQPQKP